MSGQQSTEKKIIVVTGDVTFDWNLAHIERGDGGGAGWTAEATTRACWQRGGAALLTDLIHTIGKQVGPHIDVHPNLAPISEIYPSASKFHRSYAIWKAFGKNANWRVTEFLGLDRGNADTTAEENWQFVKIKEDEAKPDIVVLDDAGLGFRDLQKYWPAAVQQRTKKPWYVLKMAHPVAEGPLWEHLVETCADRMIVVMTVNDLRLKEVHVSRQFSWERTAQDIVWELTYNNAVKRLSQCAHTLVSFDTSGAILISNTGESLPSARLFFDALRSEGEWNREYEGMMIGYTTTLTAAVVRELMIHPTTPDMTAGVQSGISAMRYLHREGYGQGAGSLDLKYPTEGVVRTFSESPKEPLSAASIRHPLAGSTGSSSSFTSGGRRLWTILGESQPDGFETIAERIVLEGLEQALRHVPVARLGKLITVDRQEIESLHSVQSLIEEYQKRDVQQPLSIAVFGPPGAGKSFYVKQVAGTVLKKKGEPLTFNLSQLAGPGDLLGALHQVRDESIRGNLPLVFWDEFDTTLAGQELGWLRYFLAPMQDGTFQQGEITHPIGRCIFVFAGGTSERMDVFETKLDSDDERRRVKLPDFASRLKGYLNILGPNPTGGDAQIDPEYIVRRAILLRAMLQQSAPNLFRNVGGVARLNIDSGVLHAFLKCSSFRHGARSLESIISMSRLKGASSFERSSLPAHPQLDLHVNGTEFLTNVYRLRLDEERLDRLARAAHEVHREGIEKDYREFEARTRNAGYVETDEDRTLRKNHTDLKQKPNFDDRPNDEMEQNRDSARSIERKLAMIGCVVLPQRGTQDTFSFTTDELEKLSKDEHDRWVTLKKTGGWKLGPTTDKANKIHQSLVDWEELPESEREKDRRMVRAIPTILEKVGYTAVRLPGK